MIVVGLVSLLTHLRVIESIRWDLLWPAAFVLVGLLILLPLACPPGDEAEWQSQKSEGAPIRP